MKLMLYFMLFSAQVPPPPPHLLSRWRHRLPSQMRAVTWPYPA